MSEKWKKDIQTLNYKQILTLRIFFINREINRVNQENFKITCLLEANLD